MLIGGVAHTAARAFKAPESVESTGTLALDVTCVLSLPAAVAIGVAARRRTRKAQLIASLAVGVMIGVPALGVLLGLVGLAAGVK